jgi:hypothetical protein
MDMMGIALLRVLRDPLIPPDHFRSRDIMGVTLSFSLRSGSDGYDATLADADDFWAMCCGLQHRGVAC